MNWRAISARKPTTYLAVGMVVAALGIAGCGSAAGSSGNSSTSRSASAPAGRFPGHFGTPVTGTTATKVSAAARAKYKGTVRRVLKLQNGSYVALVITPQGPYRVTVNNNFKVTGAQQFSPPAGGPPGS